ncbi:MAG: IspD/TarI family cytidylyltransferase, partial [Desulfobulbales bacterium]
MSEHYQIIAAAIIPAAGSGTRLGAALPKQFVVLNGKPMLVLSISRFLPVKQIRFVAVAVADAYRQTAENMINSFFSPDERQRIIITGGGLTRQASVQAGLRVLPAETEIVMVHDGARPFVTPAIIEDCLQQAYLRGAAIVAVQVRDTLKKAGPDHSV